MASSSNDTVRRHNMAVLNSLKRGDLVEIKMELYSHWAVFVGDKTLVHFDGHMEKNVGVGTPFGKRYKDAYVQSGDFFDVVKDNKAYKNNTKDETYRPRPANDIVNEAKAMVGEHIGYNMIWHNCEHFASSCRYGVKDSEQSDLIGDVLDIAGYAVLIPAVVIAEPLIKLAEVLLGSPKKLKR